MQRPARHIREAVGLRDQLRRVLDCPQLQGERARPEGLCGEADPRGGEERKRLGGGEKWAE